MPLKDVSKEASAGLRRARPKSQPWLPLWAKPPTRILPSVWILTARTERESKPGMPTVFLPVHHLFPVRPVRFHHAALRIGEQRKRVALFSAEGLVLLGRVIADRDDADSACVEIRKPLLETPQLGVAEWSPPATIENEQHAARLSGAAGRG